MRQAVVHSGQSIFDIAIQHCGSVDAAYGVAVLNSLPLDAILEPGQTLLVPEVTDKRVVEELRRRGVVPGTVFWLGPTLAKKSSWFLPSAYEAVAIYENLIAHGLGGFEEWSYYWTSSATAGNSSTEIQLLSTGNGDLAPTNQYGSRAIRACRLITINELSYSHELRDVTSDGGMIFHRLRSGLTSTYFEAAPADLISGIWIDVPNVMINTSKAVGTGLANSQAIIAYPGHTKSAAQDCLNYQLPLPVHF